MFLVRCSSFFVGCWRLDVRGYSLFVIRWTLDVGSWKLDVRRSWFFVPAATVLVAVEHRSRSRGCRSEAQILRTRRIPAATVLAAVEHRSRSGRRRPVVCPDRHCPRCRGHGRWTFLVRYSSFLSLRQWSTDPAPAAAHRGPSALKARNIPARGEAPGKGQHTII
jgi:hypothetical protein